MWYEINDNKVNSLCLKFEVIVKRLNSILLSTFESIDQIKNLIISRSFRVCTHNRVTIEEAIQLQIYAQAAQVLFISI